MGSAAPAVIELGRLRDPVRISPSGRLETRLPAPPPAAAAPLAAAAPGAAAGGIRVPSGGTVWPGEFSSALESYLLGEEQDRSS